MRKLLMSLHNSCVAVCLTQIQWSKISWPLNWHTSIRSIPTSTRMLLWCPAYSRPIIFKMEAIRDAPINAIHHHMLQITTTMIQRTMSDLWRWVFATKFGSKFQGIFQNFNIYCFITKLKYVLLCIVAKPCE